MVVNCWKWLAVTALLASLFVVRTAFAEGSNGQGGAVGERSQWPCPGCFMNTPPDYDPAQPTALMVTFHGDEGDPDYIKWKLEDQVADAGMLMLSLKCPNALGCNQYDGSWWQWEAYVAGHDETWVGEQVDAVEAEYNVELQRVFLVGFSGGSSYLSWYARDFSDRFAAVAYLAGGYAPWNGQCQEPCPIPAYFLIGTNDFLLDGAQELRDYYQSCGHEVVFDLHQGIDHEIISSGLPALMTWFGSHEHLCREEPEEPEPPPGGCTEAPDCMACVSCIDVCACNGGDLQTCYDECGDPPDEGEPVDPPVNNPDDDDDGAGRRIMRSPSGCVCSTPGPPRSSPAGLLWLLAIAVAQLRARRGDRDPTEPVAT